MWCLVDGTAGNAEVPSVSTSKRPLGSWGVVPEVLEISQLGHDVAEHLVAAAHGVSSPASGLHVQRLVSIIGHFDTVLIGPTLVVEQVDNEVQPILLELSSSIENSRDLDHLDQYQRFGIACTRQASGMVHIVSKVTVQLSGSLGFCRIDSTQFCYLLNSVSQIFAD